MLLATTSAKIEFVLGENHSTNQIPAYAAWFDSQTSPTASSAGVNSNDTSQVTLVASPGASVIRQINEVTICNTDTISHTVKVRFNDGTNQFIMAEATLPVGASFVYSKQFGWAILNGIIPGQILGTATNDSAAAGNVGEYISSTIAIGSAIPLVSGTPKTITSISLTPGDWDVDGTVAHNPAGTTQFTGVVADISLVTNTLDTTPGNLTDQNMNSVVPAFGPTANVGPVRYSFATTTTVFLVADASFTVSTDAAYGILRARRVR